MGFLDFPEVRRETEDICESGIIFHTIVGDFWPWRSSERPTRRDKFMKFTVLLSKSRYGSAKGEPVVYPQGRRIKSQGSPGCPKLFRAVHRGISADWEG